MLTGCPEGIPYPFDKVGNTPLDPGLIGAWKCNPADCAEIKQMAISKGTEPNSYEIRIIEAVSTFKNGSKPIHRLRQQS